nr:MAG TPA: tail assembly chaperone protein [Caudoviricetes sp.]
MSESQNLTAFLKNNVEIVNQVEYVASNRIKAGDEPVAWKINVLQNKVIDKLRNRYTKMIKDGKTGVTREKFDSQGFNDAMLLESIVFPNLDDMELQDSWGVNDPLELVKAMLTPGEYADLLNAVVEAQGFEVGMDEKVRAVKNS